jgi:hypothetical protein
MSEGVKSHRDEENPPVRRPGPHGAAAGDAEQDEAVARAYRRAERTTRRSFQEVTPRTVTAAEAVTSIDEEFDADDLPKNGAPFVKSRACFIATAAYGDADAPGQEDSGPLPRQGGPLGGPLGGPEQVLSRARRHRPTCPLPLHEPT